MLWIFKEEVQMRSAILSPFLDRIWNMETVIPEDKKDVYLPIARDLRAATLARATRKEESPGPSDDSITHEPGEGYLEYLIALAEDNLKKTPQLRPQFDNALAVIKAVRAMGGLTGWRVKTIYLNHETLIAYSWVIFIATGLYQEPIKAIDKLFEIRDHLTQDTLIHEWVEKSLREHNSWIAPATRSFPAL